MRYEEVPDNGFVDDAVAVEEDGALQRTVSHFVAAALSAG